MTVLSYTSSKVYDNIMQELTQQLLREYALALAKNHQCDEALEAASHIHDSEVQDYTFSIIAEEEARHGHFSKAEKITQRISDRDYYEDAVTTIVKLRLLRHEINEAFDFTQRIKDNHTRKKCALSLHCAFKASHLKDKVRSLEKLFSFHKTGLREE